MSSLTFGNFPANLFDTGYLGFGEFFPSAEPSITLSRTEIGLRDPITGARIALIGNFVIEDGLIVDGTVTRMTWTTGSGALLLDWTELSVSIWDALYLDPTAWLGGNDTITGGAAADVLLGLGGDDLVRGGGGDDLLIALEGHDTLEGGPGIDLLISGDAHDWDAALYIVSGALLADAGERVVFVARADMLGDLPPTGELSFFRADLDTLGVERVFDPFQNGDLFEDPALSGDGRLIAAIAPVTWAGLPGWNYPQLLLVDLDTGQASVESRTPDGSLARYMPGAPAISADGGTLAFVYLDGDLIADDTNGVWDVFYKRVGSDTIARASEAADGTEADASSAQPVLSGDGSLIAFVSAATNLTAQSNGTPAAYVRNLDTGELRWVAEIVQPRHFAFDIGQPPIALSTNGRYLAFVSARSDLVPDDTNGVPDVFVTDLATDTTLRASVDFDGAQGDAYCDQPAISGDGRFVAFVSRSTWPEGLYDSNFSDDVFVKDLANDMLYRIPVPDHDFVGMASVSAPQLSFDGQTLVYRYASDGAVLARLDDSGLHLMRGGAGDDIYVLARDEAVLEAAGEGYDVVASVPSRYVLPANVEALAHPFPGGFEGVGNAADNRFLGGPGDDRWFGDGGLDRLTHTAPFAEVTVSRDGDDWILSHPAQGTDRLSGVERVAFADTGLALDIDGNAGAALALWYAATDAMPAAVEITPWIDAFDAGQAPSQVAQGLLDFFATIVGTISDEMLVTTLWNNIARTPLDEATLDFYLGALQGGGYTQAALYADAAAHPLNHDHYAPLAVSGIAYQPSPFDWGDVIDAALNG